MKQTIRDAEQTDKCPPGWTLISGKCYFFSDERKTQVESDSFCYRKKVQLATVKPSDTSLLGASLGISKTRILCYTGGNIGGHCL
uniref:C-type lectin domain-containing protein n=1 Tax=Xenopus tropicalis TaxID=8364 RepID=A0A1B8Y0Y1_XENTR